MIKTIRARQILDSRGNPTVACSITTENDTFCASVPSGASTGSHEAIELRDGGKAFGGKGVLKAVRNINTTIARSLRGKTFTQHELDEKLCALDGTDDKRKLGANATLAVSMAYARTQGPLYNHIGKLYSIKRFTLPIPSLNILNGGKHAGNNLAFQEYMIQPRAKRFSDALRIGAEIYHTLRERLLRKYGKSAVNVGDEGGFAPPMKDVEEPLRIITKTISELGYARNVSLGIDCAASEFYSKGSYTVNGKKLSAGRLHDYYERLAKTYNLATIEDPFFEEDFASFAQLQKTIKARIVGDDLLTTNPIRINEAIAKKSCTCLLLKPNQIGTVTQALHAAQLAHDANWSIMASHRSGETCDSFIADFAVGIGAKYIKAGAPARGERVAKYNRLLRIEEEL